MKRKYIPTNEGDLITWLQNVSRQIPAIGAALGMSAADIQLMQETADKIVTKIGAYNYAKTEYNRTRADKETEKLAGLSYLVVALTHLMANPNWTDAFANTLATNSTPTVLDFTSYKAEVKCKVTGGEVLLRILKRGVKAVNIYSRIGNTGPFVLLERVNMSTYIDRRSLATPGIAEIRQYMVMGVHNDKEIGLPSDIITISYAG